MRIQMFCVLIAMCISSSANGQPVYPEDPWPMQGRTAARVGSTTVLGPQVPAVAWTTQFAFQIVSESARSSVVIDRWGRAFVGTGGGVTAIDTLSRELLWFTTDLDTVKSPATHNGRVYWGTASQDSFFYCSDGETGQTIWSFVGDSGMAAPVIDNGIVYVSDRLSNVYAKEALTGDEVWTVLAYDGGSNAIPSVANGALVTSHSGGTIVSLNTLTGAENWSQTLSESHFGPIPHNADRFILASADEEVRSLDSATGQEVWSYTTGANIDGTVAFGHDGTIYVGDSSGPPNDKFHAIAPDGTHIWSISLFGSVVAPPVVGGDGTIYVCSVQFGNESALEAVSPDGDILWTLPLSAVSLAPPAIAPDGTLFVVTDDRLLHAIHDPPNPSLDVSGTCPGPATLTITGGTPGGVVALVAARNRGTLFIPNGQTCGGTQLFLNQPAQIVATVHLDAQGNATLDRQVPPAACGWWVQAIDVASCHTSNILSLE